MFIYYILLDASFTDEFSDLLKEDMVELAPNMSVALKNKDYTDLTVSKLNLLINTWINKRENITTRFESVFGKLFIFVLKYL